MDRLEKRREIKESDAEPSEKIKSYWNLLNNHFPMPFVVLFFIVAALSVSLILYLGSMFLAVAGLAAASILGSLTVISATIDEYYFNSSYEALGNLVLIPDVGYIYGFAVGGILLSSYIYFAYFYATGDLEFSDSLYSSVFAGIGLMSFGRLSHFYWSSSVVNTIQSGILDILQAFSIFIAILLFKTIAESRMETSFRDVFTLEVSDDEKRKMEQDMANNNPFVNFFYMIVSNPLYHLVSLFMIIGAGYSTFLIEKNLPQLIDMWWIQALTIAMVSSYIYTAFRAEYSS